GLFLPVFQHLELGGDIVQFFLDLGKENFAGTSLVFVRQRQFDALARQSLGEATLPAFARRAYSPLLLLGQLFGQRLDLDRCLGFVEQGDLISTLLAAGGKLLDALEPQHFFEQFDANISLLQRLFLLLHLKLKRGNRGTQFSRRLAVDIGIRYALCRCAFHAAYYSKNSALNHYKLA